MDTSAKGGSFVGEGNTNPAGVGQFMCSLFDKQLYTDVKFSTDVTKESISAHRAVLAAKSKFFKNLLFGPQKNLSAGMEMQVKISNVSFSTFKDILKYFYTGDIDLSDDSTVLDIYSAAENFQIQPLKEQCEKYIEFIKITEDNVCFILQNCSSKDIQNLKSRCVHFIQQNTLQVISSPNFEKCSYSTVREICEFSCLNLSSEIELLEAVLRWINIQPNHTKEELIKSLLKSIRFLSLNATQFAEVMDKYRGLIPPEDALKILMYLHTAIPPHKKEELPQWCNTSCRSFNRQYKTFPKDITQRAAEGNPKDLQITIPLEPSKEQLIRGLTSVLQMKCIKGIHQINSIKLSFEDVPKEKNMIPILTIRSQVSPNGCTLVSKKMVDSKEVVFNYRRGIVVSEGHVFHLEIEAKASDQYKFLQFDALEKSFQNYHFHFSFASIPKLGNFFCIAEVQYRPLRL